MYCLVIIVTAAGGGAGAGEGRQAVRLRGVLVAGAQPLCDPDLRVLGGAGAGRLQQPAGLPPAHRLPAAVLRLPPAAGPRLVEVPTALPRDNVQGGNVFRLDPKPRFESYNKLSAIFIS